MKCFNCVEIAARLHLYLDRELNSEEITIVQQHLTDCPGCQCRFHVDMSIKQLIHERCTIQYAPERLRVTATRLAHMSQRELQTLDPTLIMEIRTDMQYDDC